MTEQGAAALAEFGFDPVPLEQPGAPTPGRIADRLSDIEGHLTEAYTCMDAEALVAGIRELSRLRLALDAWDADQMQRITP